MQTWQALFFRMKAEGVWSVWSSRSILVLLKCLFQIHHASLKNMSRLVTLTKNLLSKNSFRTAIQFPHSWRWTQVLKRATKKVGTRWPSNLAIRPWKFVITNQKKCYAKICTESIQAPPLILESNPFCAPFDSDTTVDAASNGTDEWWRKMRTFPSAFFL